jgi:hypothetical protein
MATDYLGRSTMKQGDWNRRITGEPSLLELLADPCLQALMRRDGVDMICLLNMIAAAQTRLAGDRPPTRLAA